MKKLFLSILVVFTFTILKAQKNNFTVYYSPQFLFVNAVKLDFEIQKVDNPRSSILLSPYIQMGKTNISGGASNYYSNGYNANSTYYYDNYDYPDDLLGAGLNFLHKIYLVEGKIEESKHFPYFSYGASYLFSKISYDFAENIYNNGSYEFKTASGVDKMNIFGVQTTMGDRIEMGHVFVLDIYAGLGIKYSDISTSNKGARNYSRNIFDYAYTGIHPVLGMRLGFKI